MRDVVDQAAMGLGHNDPHKKARHVLLPTEGGVSDDPPTNGGGNGGTKRRNFADLRVAPREHI